MTGISFGDLPLIVRLTSMASLFMGWVLFAEFAIDRYGWDKFLPFYRVGDICPYEFVVLALIGLLWWRLERS